MDPDRVDLLPQRGLRGEGLLEEGARADRTAAGREVAALREPAEDDRRAAVARVDRGRGALEESGVGLRIGCRAPELAQVRLVEDLVGGHRQLGQTSVLLPEAAALAVAVDHSSDVALEVIEVGRVWRQCRGPGTAARIVEPGPERRGPEHRV